MRGATQLERLNAAMLTTPAACSGDDRFIADQVADADATEMRRICRGCPLFDLCDAFARRNTPEAGFWAGRIPRSRGVRADGN